MTEIVDNTARESAAEAHRRMDEVVKTAHEIATAAAVTARGLTDHEEQCVEARARDAQDNEDIKNSIKGLYDRWWWVMGTLVVGMAGMIVTLIVFVNKLQNP